MRQNHQSSSDTHYRALTNSHESSIRVYSTGDGPDVYEDEFMKIAKPPGEEFHPTLVLVGTRLGIDKITPVYWEALIAALQMPQSVGIAGQVLSIYHPHLQRTDKTQWSPIIVPLLYRRARIFPFLPRSSSYKTSPSIPRRPHRIHQRRNRIVSHLSAAPHPCP
jgi:hypothetical protein